MALKCKHGYKMSGAILAAASVILSALLVGSTQVTAQGSTLFEFVRRGWSAFSRNAQGEPG